MATFNLEIVTPIGKKFSDDVEFIIVRTTEGDMGILPNHSPFVAALQPECIKIKFSKDKEVKYYISNGFIEVNTNKVVIIVDEAMLPEEIDLERAKQEVALAQDKLKQTTEDTQVLLVERSLQAALVKVKIGEGLI